MKRKLISTLVMAAAAGLAIVGGTAATASAGTAGADSPAVTRIAPGGTWGTIQPLDGVYANDASVTPAPGISSLSCAGPGDCSAIGNSEAATDPFGAFGVSEVNGVWGQLQHLPGIPFFDDENGEAEISCTAPGDCTAGGTADGKDGRYAVVISQVNGVWGAAQPVNTKSLGAAGTMSWLYSLACSSPGNCAATGMLGGENKSFVVAEKNGVWSAAQVARGAFGNVISMSCGATGDCMGFGLYLGPPGGFFVIIEKNGVWGNETAIPGPKNANYNDASCSGTTCTVAGFYETKQGTQYFEHFFVISETDGVWGKATTLWTVHMTGAGGYGIELSCPKAGSCSLVASLWDGTTNTNKVVAVTEANGTWGAPQDVFGADNPQVAELSCPSAGNCAVAGFDTTYSPAKTTAYFVASQVDGTWTTAHTVAIPTAVSGPRLWSALSCGQAGYCTAVAAFPSPVAGNATLQYVVNEAGGSDLALSVKVRSAPYGDDGKAVVTATMTGPSGTPTGTVTVTNGSTPVCAFALTDGAGQCAPGAASLPAGTHRLTATYSGDPAYASFARAVPPFTIAKASTRTALTLSTGRVSYGHETAERLAVKVTAAFDTTATGRVTIKTGKTTLCTVYLRAGVAHCTLTARQLKPGTRNLTAVYAGGRDYQSSASATKPVTITG
jgi:Bacterial Ig-like domain (group 3)